MNSASRTRRYHFAILLCIVAITEVNGQSAIPTVHSAKAKPVTFTGEVSKECPHVYRIVADFINDFVYSNNGAQIFDAQLTDTGSFSLQLPAIDHPGKLTLVIYDSINQATEFEYYVVEPGDSIHVHLSYRMDGYSFAFTGRGSAKYQCRQNLENRSSAFLHYTIMKNRYMDYSPPSNFPVFYKDAKNLFQENLKVLENYRSQINADAYNNMVADVYGEFKYATSTRMETMHSYTMKNPELRNKLEKLYKVYQIHQIDQIGLPAITRSEKYLYYIMFKERFEFEITHSNNQPTFLQLYGRLKRNYTGILREQLLALFISDWTSTLLKLGPEHFEACLKEIYFSVKLPYLKHALDSFYSHLVKGSPGFNFVLPDTAGKYVRFTDFRGKIVLLDVWGTGCSGCAAFHQTLENDILPSLQADTNFVLVTISIDEERDRWIKSIYSNVYTSPSHINLYTEGQHWLKHPFCKYYNLQSLPLILVYDKNGKLSAELYSFEKPELVKIKIQNILQEQ